MKTCAKCNESKDESEYRLTKTGKYLMGSCTTCFLKAKAIEQREYRLRNPTRNRHAGSKELRVARKARYEAKHPEKAKAGRTRYRVKKQLVHPERCAEEKKRAREKVTGGYARQLLSAQIGLPRAEIPETLVHLKREQLLTRRLLKQLTEIIGEKHDN